MNEPLVSVIIPTYNRANIVCQAIISAFNQTYKSKEIIVVDDGSTDNTKEILSQYGNRLKYIYKINGGVSSARNAGIREAKGEYIAFLDSDDLWYPDKIEKQVRPLIGKQEYGMAISEIDIIDRNGSHLYYSELWKNSVNSEYVFDDIIKNFLIKPQVVCSYMLINKDVFSKIGFFDESLSTAEDIDIMLRISSLYKVLLIKEPLVKYKKQEDSLSNIVFSKNRLKVINKIADYNPHYYKTNRKLIVNVIANINMSYAEDLLWHRYYSKARAQTLESMKKKITLKALSLYLKSILIQCLSLVVKSKCSYILSNPEYKDKGYMNK